MTRRDLADKYVGQAFGLMWSVCHPIFLICLYVFVFAFVFKQKFGGTADLPLDYTAFLLSGLVPWLGLQEALSKSCTTITSNSALVKQVVFPLEVLPIKSVLASLFPQLVSLSVIIIYVFMVNNSLLVSYLALPFIMIFQFMFMTGIAYFLSPIGVYFRDLKDFVQLFCISGIYLLPVFYLPDMVPRLFKPVLFLNPFSHLIWCYQDTLFYGRMQHPFSWMIVIGISLFTFTFGYRFFKLVRPQLGNIL